MPLSSLIDFKQHIFLKSILHQISCSVTRELLAIRLGTAWIQGLWWHTALERSLEALEYAERWDLDQGGGTTHERRQPGFRLICCKKVVMGTKQRMNYGVVRREMGSRQIYYAPFPLCQQAAQSLRGTDLFRMEIFQPETLSQIIRFGEMRKSYFVKLSPLFQSPHKSLQAVEISSHSMSFYCKRYGDNGLKDKIILIRNATTW